MWLLETTHLHCCCNPPFLLRAPVGWIAFLLLGKWFSSFGCTIMTRSNSSSDLSFSGLFTLSISFGCIALSLSVEHLVSVSFFCIESIAILLVPLPFWRCGASCRVRWTRKFAISLKRLWQVIHSYFEPKIFLIREFLNISLLQKSEWNLFTQW